jgi:preprotein translocase subunit SecD
MWYYTIDDRQQNLFGQHTITVSWGMDLFSGTQKQFSFDSVVQRDDKIRDILKKKTKTYKVLYSYFKEKNRRSDAASSSSAHTSAQSAGRASLPPDSMVRMA